MAGCEFKFAIQRQVIDMFGHEENSYMENQIKKDIINSGRPKIPLKQTMLRREVYGNNLKRSLREKLEKYSNAVDGIHFFTYEEVFSHIFFDFTNYLNYQAGMDDTPLYIIDKWLHPNQAQLKESAQRKIIKQLTDSGINGQAKDGSPVTNFMFFIPNGGEYSDDSIMYTIETYIKGTVGDTYYANWVRFR